MQARFNVGKCVREWNKPFRSSQILVSTSRAVLLSATRITAKSRLQMYSSAVTAQI
jgi:hypothetical protein